jgi:hypothetical protein
MAMKNDMKIRLVWFLFLALVMVMGQAGCSQGPGSAPEDASLADTSATPTPTVDSFFVGTSIGSIDSSTEPHQLTDTIALSFFQANLPFVDSITFFFQTDPACIRMFGVLPGTSLSGSATCNGEDITVKWNTIAVLSPDSTTLQVIMAAQSTISCKHKFAFGGSLVVVLSEVDPQCPAPKIWCRKAIFSNTGGSSTSFRFGINRK